MPRRAQTRWLKNFQGYSDSIVPGGGLTTTSDLLNVKTRFGHVFGRGGMTKWNGISTSSGTDIIGLFNYRLASGTHRATRMLPAAFQEFSSGAWNAATGTALTGTQTSQPQYTIIDDTLIFTNGVDLPRKYTGTGNSSSIASGTSPYGKGVVNYLGFLFIFNVSDSGTFTDVVDGHRMGRYSDDWDNNWTGCDGNSITLDETPGAWNAAVVLGRNLYCLKTDGIVQVRFVGGALRFNQELMGADVGCVAPLSLAQVGDTMALFLGTDGVIYTISAQGIAPVTHETLWNTLPTTLSLARLKWARGVVDSEEDTYYLFYDRTGLSNQLLDSYVSYNYRTREVQKGTLGTNIIATCEFKPTDQQAEAILVSTPTLVEEFDSGADDDGVAITRRWTTGWQTLESSTAYLHGVRLVARKSRNARVKIDVATNFDPTYQFTQVFSLQGGSPSDELVDITYHIPPQRCENVKVRVRFYADSATAGMEMQALGLEVSDSQPTGDMPDRGQINRKL